VTIFQEDVVTTVPRLRAFARSLTNGDRQLADDLVQDTVVNALRAQRQFTPGTNLEAWLFAILRNRFRSLVGRRRNRLEQPQDDKELERVFWTPPAQDAVIEIAAFRRAFRDLAPSHREVLVLVGVHGLSYERVAEICGCQIGTVKSRINRARTVLKAKLLGEDMAAQAGRSNGTERRRRRLTAEVATTEAAG
jgi:RNA polymerase sigma-70 factor (ECF subfamily)